MPPSSAEVQPSAVRPTVSPGVLIAVGVWACTFVVFIVLGLQS